MAERLSIRDFGKQINIGASTTVLGTFIAGINSSITVTFWMKLSINSVTRTILTNVVSPSDRFGAIVSSSGLLCAGFYNGSSYTGKVSSGKRVDDNQWHRVSITWDGATMTMIIDGATQAGTTQPIIQSTAGFSIGCDTNGTAPLRGYLDELCIYPSVLSTSQQAQSLNGVVGGCSALFRFNDSLNDDSGNNVSVIGTYVTYVEDSPTPTRTTATPRITASNRVAVRDMGTALRFDGVDDEVEITSALVGTSFNTENPHTYTAWVNVQAIQGLNNRGIIDKYASTTGVTKLGSRLTITTGGYVNFMYGDGVGQHDTGVSTANIVPLRTWVHVAGVYTGTQVMVCINGVCRTATATYPSSNLNSTIEIGGTHHSNGKINALIDEPRIWNRALTATEIQNLYLHNIVPQDGLVAEYLFDEATGTTAIDTSGNGNDGVISGCTYTTDTPLRPRTSV